MSLISNMQKPAPRWVRIFKKVLSNAVNFTIGILLLLGYTDSSLTLLIIKLSQSFVMDMIDTFSANGEVYAQADTTTISATFKTVAAPNDSEVSNNK